MFEKLYENSGKFFFAVKLNIIFWHCTNNQSIHVGIGLPVTFLTISSFFRKHLIFMQNQLYHLLMLWAFFL